MEEEEEENTGAGREATLMGARGAAIKTFPFRQQPIYMDDMILTIFFIFDD